MTDLLQRRRLWIAATTPLLLFLVGLLIVPHSAPPAGTAIPQYADFDFIDWELKEDRLPPLIVVGDTQATSWMERWLLRRESNPEVPSLLLKYVAEEQPGLLVLLGDLTFEAASGRAWADFDAAMKPVHRQSIPVLVAAGNHDYGFLGSTQASLEHFRRRFPQAQERHWYSRVYGSLGLIWVDTNEEHYSPEEWRQQQEWYTAELARFDTSHRVNAVLIFSHHPPYTNNTRTPDELHVQRTFVPAFKQAHKTVAFFSGHAHGYERLQKNGKWFIVSGGGGGPRVQYDPPEKKQHVDRYDYAGTTERPFHYLRLTQGVGSLQVEALGFDKGETDLRRLDRFEIAINPHR